MERTGDTELSDQKANGPTKDLGSVSKRRRNGSYNPIHDNRRLEEVTMAKIKWYHWTLIGIGSLAMFFGVIIAIWFGFYRGEVVSYGDPMKVYFKDLNGNKENVQGVEGEKIWFCLDDVVWKQICPSTLATQLTPTRGPRLDLETHVLNNPPTASRVPPKCRRWEVPELTKDQTPGPAVMSGHVRSECSPLDHWYPIYTPMPSAKFNWVRRTP